MIVCKVCGGEGLLLGRLGERFHYRCRNCGLDFSIGPRRLFAEENDEPEEEMNDDSE